MRTGVRTSCPQPYNRLSGQPSTGMRVVRSVPVQQGLSHPNMLVAIARTTCAEANTPTPSSTDLSYLCSDGKDQAKDERLA
jgi:hypothetical protein